MHPRHKDRPPMRLRKLFLKLLPKASNPSQILATRTKSQRTNLKSYTYTAQNDERTLLQKDVATLNIKVWMFFFSTLNLLFLLYWLLMLLQHWNNIEQIDIKVAYPGAASNISRK